MVQHKPSHEPGGWVDFFKPHTDREREHTDRERESMAPKRSRSGSGGLAPSGSRGRDASRGGEGAVVPRTAQSMQQAAGLLAGGKGRHVARDRSGDQRDEQQGTRGGPESGCEDGGRCGSDDGAASAEDSQVLDADGAGTRQLASTTLDKRMEKSGGGRGAVGRVSTPDQVCLSWDSELSWCVHW